MPTDDIAHSAPLFISPAQPEELPFGADLSSLLTDQPKLTWNPHQRRGFVPPGIALADATIARLVLGKLGLF